MVDRLGAELRQDMKAEWAELAEFQQF